MFLSDDAVANELNVTIRFPESGKMRFSAVYVGILKSFFHIGIYEANCISCLFYTFFPDTV